MQRWEALGCREFIRFNKAENLLLFSEEAGEVSVILVDFMV
jgi:hypothetical protein